VSIVLFIRSLNFGGAEQQVGELAKGLVSRWHDVVVAVFYADSKLFGEVHDAGVRLVVLEKRGRKDLIIANSWSGADHHQRLGYPADKMVVIPNGIDVSRVRPDPEADSRQRVAWGIPERRAGRRVGGAPRSHEGPRNVFEGSTPGQGRRAATVVSRRGRRPPALS